MTRDERFSAEYNGFQDHKTGRRLTEWFEIVRVLNELAEENKQLKKELFETSKELLWATSDDVDRVLYFKNEVEDLRKEIWND